MSSRRTILGAAALVLLGAACDGPSEPCEQWGGCHPGEVVVRVEFLDRQFPARERRAGRPVWGPNDTVEVRIAVENQSRAPTDSFTLAVGYGPKRRDHWSRVLEFSPQHVSALQPGARAVFTDTAFIGPETRDSVLRLDARVNNLFGPPVAGRLAGDTLLPVLSSGVELAMAGVPGQRMLQVWGRWDLWTTWPAHSSQQVLLRVSNPYELPLPPLQLTWCYIDVDYCPLQGNVAALTPEVPPGESRDVWVPFTLANTAIRWFWDYAWGEVAICHPRWLAGTCARFKVQLAPDFEAECPVATIVPGQQVTDDAIECDQTGSAYRFGARKGEQYRLSVSAGTAFIVGPDGKEQGEPMETQVTIPKDGDYYVILDQRLRRQASFTLERVN